MFFKGRQFGICDRNVKGGDYHGHHWVTSDTIMHAYNHGKDG